MIEFRKTEQIETVFRSLPVFVQQHSRMVGQYAKLLIDALSQIKYKPLLDALPAEVPYQAVRIAVLSADWTGRIRFFCLRRTIQRGWNGC